MTLQSITTQYSEFQMVWKNEDDEFDVLSLTIRQKNNTSIQQAEPREKNNTRQKMLMESTTTLLCTRTMVSLFFTIEALIL